MHSSIREISFRYPRLELRLHLNVVPTVAGIFKSRHILLHKYENRIIPSRSFRFIECRHFDLFWKCLLFPLRCIVYSIHLIYRYWRILFFLHEELLLLILVLYIFRLISICKENFPPKVDIISILVMLENVLYFIWYEVWNRLYHVIRGKSDHVAYFQNKSKWRHSMDLKRRLGMMSCIWRHSRWSWFYLHIYAAKYVYFWILQRRLARHWGAGVIHAGSRRGYLKKHSRIELCMVDKGFGGRQYQKTTLASNPKRN